MTPGPRPLLPPTGGGHPFDGLVALPLSVMLLLIGMNIHLLTRKEGIKVDRDDA